MPSAPSHPVTVGICADVSVTMRGLPLAELNRGLDALHFRLSNLAAREKDRVSLTISTFDHAGGKLVLPPTTIGKVEKEALNLVNAEPTGREGPPDLKAGLAVLLPKLPAPVGDGSHQPYTLLVLVLHNEPLARTRVEAEKALDQHVTSRIYTDGRNNQSHPAVYLTGLVAGEVAGLTCLKGLVEQRGMKAHLRGLMFREAFDWLAERAVEMLRSEGDYFKILGNPLVGVWADAWERVPPVS